MKQQRSTFTILWQHDGARQLEVIVGNPKTDR
jgi:hypothetical protein